MIKDDDDNAVTVPAATSIAAGGYYATDFPASAWAATTR